MVDGVHFMEFVGVGLIISAAVQNAFANTSSVIIVSKMMGTIIDFLLPPLTSFEVIIALTFGAITRAVIVAILSYLALSIFIDLHIHNILITIFYLVSGSVILALLGIIAAIVSESFEKVAAFTNYFITPFSFLSGSLYSVSHLPPLLKYLNNFNPFFYIIDGFRYGMSGISSTNTSTSFLVIMTTLIILIFITGRMFSKRLKIKG